MKSPFRRPSPARTMPNNDENIVNHSYQSYDMSKISPTSKRKKFVSPVGFPKPPLSTDDVSSSGSLLPRRALTSVNDTRVTGASDTTIVQTQDKKKVVKSSSHKKVTEQAGKYISLTSSFGTSRETENDHSSSSQLDVKCAQIDFSNVVKDDCWDPGANFTSYMNTDETTKAQSEILERETPNRLKAKRLWQKRFIESKIRQAIRMSTPAKIMKDRKSRHNSEVIQERLEDEKNVIIRNLDEDISDSFEASESFMLEQFGENSFDSVSAETFQNEQKPTTSEVKLDTEPVVESSYQDMSSRIEIVQPYDTNVTYENTDEIYRDATIAAEKLEMHFFNNFQHKNENQVIDDVAQDDHSLSESSFDANELDEDQVNNNSLLKTPDKERPEETPLSVSKLKHWLVDMESKNQDYQERIGNKDRTSGMDKTTAITKIKTVVEKNRKNLNDGNEPVSLTSPVTLRRSFSSEHLEGANEVNDEEIPSVKQLKNWLAGFEDKSKKYQQSIGNKNKTYVENKKVDLAQPVPFRQTVSTGTSGFSNLRSTKTQWQAPVKNEKKITTTFKDQYKPSSVNNDVASASHASNAVSYRTNYEAPSVNGIRSKVEHKEVDQSQPAQFRKTVTKPQWQTPAKNEKKTSCAPAELHKPSSLNRTAPSGSSYTSHLPSRNYPKEIGKSASSGSMTSATSVATSSTNGSTSYTSIKSNRNPVRHFKPKIENTEVAATNDSRVSVSKLSEWLSDKPFETRKVKPDRRGQNIAMKAQMFESVPEQKQPKPQSKLQTQPYLTPASKKEMLVVSERKKWIESQFKNDTNTIEEDKDLMPCNVAERARWLKEDAFSKQPVNSKKK